MIRGVTMTLSDGLVQAIDVGLTVLNHRILTILALLMAFGLFSWAMYAGDWVHLTIAGAFGVIIFLPILWADKRPEPRYANSEQ